MGACVHTNQSSSAQLSIPQAFPSNTKGTAFGLVAGSKTLRLS